MKHKNLVILTCRDKFFGQTRKPWTSLDVDKIAENIREKGYEVELYDFHEIINSDLNLQDKTIIYAFSQKDNYRAYINDIVFQLSKRNHVIPSYDLLKCHENKGYQEIYKKEIGLESLPATYYSSYKEVDFASLSYPIVLKTTQGTNGKGVYLIKTPDEVPEVISKIVKKTSVWRKADFFRRKYFRKKKFPEYPGFSDSKDLQEYKEYLREEQNFIIQQYIPDLDFDYRVLIAFDRYYIMKRSVKKGDFRASGSKLFGFDTRPDESLLNFARFVYEKFDSPFLSIDVLFNGKDYFLVEYQALHFGMSVVMKSAGFFHKQAGEGSWEFKKEKPDAENVFARTFVSYLEKN